MPIYSFSDPDVPEVKRKLRPITDEVWEHLFVCGLCGFIHESAKRFQKHIRWYHRISYNWYVVRVRFNSVWPLCEECGKCRAKKGLSVFSDHQRLLCKPCWETRLGPPKLIQRTSLKIMMYMRRNNIKRRDDDIEAERQRIEIAGTMRNEGLLTDDEVMFSLRKINEKIAAMEHRRTRRSSDVVKNETLIEEARKAAARSRAKKGEKPDASLPSSVELGFKSDKELWKHIEQHSKSKK